MFAFLAALFTSAACHGNILGPTQLEVSPTGHFSRVEEAANQSDREIVSKRFIRSESSNLGSLKPSLEVQLRPSPGMRSFAERAPAMRIGDVGITYVNEHLLGIVFLLLSCFCFLLPAFYAFQGRRAWLATLFAAQTIVCSAYHFCDTSSGHVLFGALSGCDQHMTTTLRDMDHGLAYFIFVQMALMFCGPEDVALHHPATSVEAHLSTYTCRQNSGTPMDVIFTRIASATAIVIFLRTYSSWQWFHWECTISCSIIFIISVSAFWIFRYRYAAGTLTRLAFWRRIFYCILIPFTLCASSFIILETIGNPIWLHCIWHLLVAGLSYFGIWRVEQGDAVSFAYEDPQHNPIIAQHVLSTVPILCFVTLMSTGLVDAAANMGGPLNVTPLDSMLSGYSRPPGAYIFTLGSCYTSLVAMISWRVIDMTGAFLEQHRSCEQKALTTSAACRRKLVVYVGYAAVSCGFLAAVCNDANPAGKVMRTTLLNFFFALQTAAVAAVTAITHGDGFHENAQNARIALAGTLVIFFFVSTYFGQHVDGFKYFLSLWFKCLMLVLHGGWILTWLEEASESLEYWVELSRLQSCGNRPTFQSAHMG